MSRGRVVSSYVRADLTEQIDRAVEEGEYPSISAIVVTGLEMWRRAREGNQRDVPDFEAAANLNPEYAAAVQEELSFGFIPEARAGRNSRLVSARISDQDARAMDVIRETPGIPAETTSDLLRGFVRVCLHAIDKLNLEEIGGSRWQAWLLTGRIEQERRTREAEARAVTTAAELLAEDLAIYQRLGRLESMLGAYTEYCEHLAQLGPSAEQLGRDLLQAMPEAQTILALLGPRTAQ